MSGTGAMPSISISSASGDVSAPRPSESSGSGLGGVGEQGQGTSVAGTGPTPLPGQNGQGWGSQFWVTLIDPMTQAQFYACPATGQCSWDPPVGNFVLPPSKEGEWWELTDDSRGGLSYYYHTATGETVWERPDGFVIPLGIIQNTSIGRRLSLNASSYNKRFSAKHQPVLSDIASSERESPEPPIAESSQNHRRKDSRDQPISGDIRPRSSSLTQHRPPKALGPSSHKQSLNAVAAEVMTTDQLTRDRSDSGGKRDRSTSGLGPPAGRLRSGSTASQPDLQAVHGSRHTTQPNSGRLRITTDVAPEGAGHEKGANGRPHVPPKSPGLRSKGASANTGTNGVGIKSASSPMLGAGGSGVAPLTPKRTYVPLGGRGSPSGRKSDASASDRDKPLPSIGRPVLDAEATKAMNPVKARNHGPIFITPEMQMKRLSTGDHRTLPRALAQDIQQFVVADFAKQFFATHKTGVLFRRRVPVERMMVWQKHPLSSPLLVLNRALHKDAVKIFKVIQRIMGDRERDRPVGVRMATDPISTTRPGHLGTPPSSKNGGWLPGATAGSPPSGSDQGHGSGGAVRGFAQSSVLDEERWLLGEGLLHGELRDEIFCQLVKQLSGNPSPDSVFRGWQLLCVLLVTFPPSKNFEAYLRTFMTDRLRDTTQRIDVMAKFCLAKLAVIAKKGPRGKAPSITEIENASDAAFNPSTFGESLDSVYRLQERSYPELQVPIILPFLADGILALGGTRAEGTFRVPGEGDYVSELKARIDKGYYNLEGIDDPHVPASLLKLWLRELQDPLIPQELYNDCIGCAEEPERVVAMVGRLPTINRRVVLFIISFLQLFLDEKVLGVTKMTSANLALVMAPNLLRCNSESMAVVFNNARFEQMFVHNLLVHLRCSKVDPEYQPMHGLGAGGLSNSASMPRVSKSKTRR